MNRDEFLLAKGKNKSPLTILNYRKAFKKFDLFLQRSEKNEDEMILFLLKSDVNEKYQTLQNLINVISETVNARVTKEYFKIICIYLKRHGIHIDTDEYDLDFPRYSKPRFEGLDQTMIKRIMEVEEDFKMKTYYSGLYGAGMRETEWLKVTPAMIRFNENPVRLILPKEITKFQIPRETFVSEIPGNMIKKYVYENRIHNDRPIFGEWHKNKLIEFEQHFARLRTSIGFDTPNRKKKQQNDITLHSFRAFFTTVFMDNKLDWFGLAITGHTKYMDTYFRKSLTERQITFNSVAEKLNF